MKKRVLYILMIVAMTAKNLHVIDMFLRLKDK